MIYEYVCKLCTRRQEVIKSVKEIDTDEACTCGAILTREERVLPRALHLGFGTFKADYYPTFGKYFGSKNELNNELKRIKGEEGRELIEVGNDRTEPVRPVVDYSEADSRALHDLKKALNGS